jgi:hypothetical protein
LIMFIFSSLLFCIDDALLGGFRLKLNLNLKYYGFVMLILMRHDDEILIITCTIFFCSRCCHNATRAVEKEILNMSIQYALNTIFFSTHTVIPSIFFFLRIKKIYYATGEASCRQH